MSLSHLEDLFVHDLKDTLDAEKRLTKALPKMAKAATTPDLQAAFEKHLEVTNNQIARLKRVFKILRKPARGKRCPGMVGLIQEGSKIMEEPGSQATLDAALIGAAQKVEHYEIAAYGTLVAYAKVLGLGEAERLLTETLAEEKQTDEELTQLASKINFESEQEADGDAGDARRAAAEEADDASREKEPGFLGKVGEALSGMVSGK
jgi:ferritin-like metal-binding protein YciE